MVKIREAHSLAGPLPEDGSSLLRRIPGFDSPEPEPRIVAALDSALACADSAAAAGQVAASLDILETLAALGLDTDTLVAGILCVPLAQGSLGVETVAERFGAEVASLLNGVQRMDALNMEMTLDERRGSFANRERQGERLRKMLVSMIDDPRVVLVKLAERVQALRALGAGDESEHAQATARAVMDIYAPLAHRLGVGQIKWELEDLAFRYLQPAEYRRIATLLHERRADREQFILGTVRRLEQALAEAGFQAQVSGRPKHLYSIWRKMQRKGIGISGIYDVRAVRVLVGSVAECYSTLGIVHSLWRNLPGEFDDYIANPKPNGYRSLHTTVIGDGGKVLEVQIRTDDMHREAELGICAHWQYKSGQSLAGVQDGYEEKIGWLRQVLRWGDDFDAGDLISEHLRREAGAERVFVLTPSGHVLDLPAGATPVDFAYQVHTGLGHRCRGARVDGRIVSLDYVLNTGERVEIIRGKTEAPNREWLRSGNEYVHTARARSKIRNWFRQQNREHQLLAGRSALERELRRLALQAPNLAALARQLGFPGPDEMLISVGNGETPMSQILALLAPVGEDFPAAVREPTRTVRARRKEAEIVVAGMDNILTQFAACCRPLPGDAIAGYITAGKGVSVHRRDCSKLQSLQGLHPQRIIDVAWPATTARSHAVDLRIVAHDRSGLLQDIVTLLGTERINILDLGTTVDRHRHVATVRLTIEVASLGGLARILDRIARVGGVVSARRHSE
jgi:GTP pyrophosphokinase